MNLNDLIPSSGGGTRFGSSFITAFWQCPMLWANTYVRPHPEHGGRGMEPVVKGDALILGTLVHEALEVLYVCDMDLEAALAKYNEEASKLGLRFEDPDKREKIEAQGRRMVQKYYEWYGPKGRFPDPLDKILCVEQEIEVPLGYRDFILTSKPDVVWETSPGVIEALEHKTSASSALWSLKAKMAVGIQPAMELMAMQHEFPEFEISGVRVNALLKDRSAKSKLPDFDRAELVTHNQENLERYKNNIIMTLHEMEDLINMYHETLDQGYPEGQAASMVFIQKRNECVGFGRCKFYAPCRQTETEEILLKAGYMVKEKQ